MMNQTMIVAGIAASAAFTKNITSRPNGISMSEIVMPAGPMAPRAVWTGLVWGALMAWPLSKDGSGSAGEDDYDAFARPRLSSPRVPA